MHAATRPRSSRGFTLLELLIAVVLVGIIVAIALPSYQDHVRSSSRAAAQAYMMDVALAQTQHLADNRAYGELANLNVALPQHVAERYTITLELADGLPPGYLLKATPKAGSPQAGEPELTLNQSGAKTPSDKW